MSDEKKIAAKFYMAYVTGKDKFVQLDYGYYESAGVAEAEMRKKHSSETIVANYVSTDMGEALRKAYEFRDGLPGKSKEKSPADDYRDTSNYHGASGPYEPIKVMEYVIEELLRRKVQARCAMEVALAIKYLLRLGSKDDLKKELFKAENFIHRARTEEWMEPETEAK